MKAAEETGLVDADSHVLEPGDIWQRYLDPGFEQPPIRVTRGGDGRDFLEIEGRPARLTTTEMLGGLGGMGKSIEELAEACMTGHYRTSVPAAASDPVSRLELLDHEGISHALLFPSLGLQWEAEVEDPAYAAAHCRAYNRWIEEFCQGSGGRLLPVAHLSLGDPAGAAAELRRAVAAGARAAFLLPFTHSGLPHGHPDHDPLFAAAVELGVPVAIHTGVDPAGRDLHRRFKGLSWPEDVASGIWYLQLMFSQAVQQAFSTFFAFATFDRFPELRLVLMEAGAGWIGFWMDRMDSFYRGSLRVTMELEQEPSHYVRRQCYFSADPDEAMLPAVIEEVGCERFMWASDYPHSDHDGNYIEELKRLCAALPQAARPAVRAGNAAGLFGIS